MFRGEDLPSGDQGLLDMKLACETTFSSPSTRIQSAQCWTLIEFDLEELVVEFISGLLNPS